jgi:hypothetical protein
MAFPLRASFRFIVASHFLPHNMILLLKACFGRFAQNQTPKSSLS